MSTEPIVKYLTRCGFEPELQLIILGAIDPRLFELDDDALFMVIDSMVDFANQVTEKHEKGIATRKVTCAFNKERSK